MAAATAASSAVLSGATRPLHSAASPSTRSPVLVLPPLPALHRRSFPSINTAFLPEAQRFSSLRVRASEDTSGSVQVDDLVSDLKEKWDGLENKSTVIIYGGGAIVAVWLSSIVVGAINSVPLLPKVMELVGLGYTGWFVYRYLLFKSGRKELANDIEDLKKKISGTE